MKILIKSKHFIKKGFVFQFLKDDDNILQYMLSNGVIFLKFESLYSIALYYTLFEYSFTFLYHSNF